MADLSDHPMRHLIRFRLARTVTLAASFAVLAAACGDAPLPTAAPAPNPPTPLSPVVEPGTIGVSAREIPIGGRALLQGPLTSLYTWDELYDGLSWSIDDSRIAELSVARSDVVSIRGLEPGNTVLSVYGEQAGHRVRGVVFITVLDTVAAPSPVVVDDFYVIEYAVGGQWRYAPQIVLSDTSGRGGSAAIAAWFEMPNVGPSQHCAMLRPVDRAPTNLLHGWGTGPELYLDGPAGYRAPAGSAVVAHLTLRVPGPRAKELTLTGRVVPGTPPTAYREGIDTEVLSCG